VKGGLKKMPEKKRTANKQKHYIGFEITEDLFKKIQSEADKVCLKPSSYVRMVIAKEIRD